MNRIYRNTDGSREPQQPPEGGRNQGFLARLVIAALPAYPAGLAIMFLIPAILHTSRADALFVAQAEAVAIVPLVVLLIFGAQTLPRGVLAGFSAIFAAIILALPYLAFGAQ